MLRGIFQQLAALGGDKLFIRGDDALARLEAGGDKLICRMKAAHCLDDDLNLGVVEDDVEIFFLHTGESQRTDGKYLYKYVDAFGNTKYVYAWRLTPTDPTPKGKREKLSLRELEQQIRRDIEDGIDSTGKKMTLCQLYAKQNAQRANVKKSTMKQREQLMRLLKEDKLGLQF